MEGIHLRVPVAFLRDKRIKPNQRGFALAVFGAMWSFCGRGNICFASIGLGPEDETNPKFKNATLCSRSALSKNTVVKYKKLLMQLGWIAVKREGRGLNDTIILHEIAQTQNPTTCDSVEENLSIEVFQNPISMASDSGGVHQNAGLQVQNCTDNIVSTGEAITESSEKRTQDSKLSIQFLEEKFGKETFTKSFAIATAKGMQSNLRYVLGICKNLQNSEIHESENSKREGSTWEEFKSWAFERLTRSSITILQNIKVEQKENELLFISPVPESLQIVIRKYFSEEVKTPVAVTFETMQNEGRAA
ncbi:DNA-binding helix-turn-helix protein [Leptospira santarosai str. CBC379]|uniref:helix-turn-helix domain-containing protein n=1 Tax=Leptospira santarosai TaxID=28183 RepID=UPI000297A01C|nr:helix-turn-helix domain-containing protein [Leptospira santarosai]EKR89721.1 DNA-binding helix-turn-helix protein [Leptospira santarosai str. CBC379]